MEQNSAVDLEEQEDTWQEFDIVELEEAKQRKKDPTSFSRVICFGKCLVGPKEKNGNVYVANIVNISMIAFNTVMLSYNLKERWIWLTILTIVIGCITQILMWCVQCSDPGIVNRKQDAEKLPFYKEQQ